MHSSRRLPSNSFSLFPHFRNFDSRRKKVVDRLFIEISAPLSFVYWKFLPKNKTLFFFTLKTSIFHTKDSTTFWFEIIHCSIFAQFELFFFFETRQSFFFEIVHLIFTITYYYYYLNMIMKTITIEVICIRLIRLIMLICCLI